MINIFKNQADREEELMYWLVLNRCLGIGPQRIKKLLYQRQRLSAWFHGTTPLQALSAWFSENQVKPQKLDWCGAEKDFLWASKQSDHHLLTLMDEQYPARLRQIASPPPVLFVKGQVECLHQPQIGVVGSRHATTEGLKNAYDFSHQLASYGLVITSGLALGVDGRAHQGALSASGQTVAVLGSGLNKIYPAKHMHLASAICQSGALVSEVPIDFPPKKEHFPRRNRIISGLSLGVIVVEAAIKSGSLITANYAVEQGREVFTLPGSIHNPLAKGCHQLIRQGALCIESAKEVLAALAPVLTEYLGDASINCSDGISQTSSSSFGYTGGNPFS